MYVIKRFLADSVLALGLLAVISSVVVDVLAWERLDERGTIRYSPPSASDPAKNRQVHHSNWSGVADEGPGYGTIRYSGAGKGKDWYRERDREAAQAAKRKKREWQPQGMPVNAPQSDEYSYGGRTYQRKYCSDEERGAKIDCWESAGAFQPRE